MRSPRQGRFHDLPTVACRVSGRTELELQTGGFQLGKLPEKVLKEGNKDQTVHSPFYR